MTRWPNSMLIKPIVSWPVEPTKPYDRRRAPFRASWSATLDRLDLELSAVNATARVLQIDMDERYFRIDGYPRADARSNGPGVILTFDAFRGSLSYPCDTFDDWQDNVRAIALALEALRKVDRYGVTRRGEQYAGFKAIGSGIAMPAQMTEAEAIRVLTLHSGFDQVSAMNFRIAQRATHPDMGGDAADFDKVMQAGRVLGLTA